MAPSLLKGLRDESTLTVAARVGAARLAARRGVSGELGLLVSGVLGPLLLPAWSVRREMGVVYMEAGSRDGAGRPRLRSDMVRGDGAARGLGMMRSVPDAVCIWIKMCRCISTMKCVVHTRQVVTGQALDRAGSGGRVMWVFGIEIVLIVYLV